MLFVKNCPRREWNSGRWAATLRLQPLGLCPFSVLKSRYNLEAVTIGPISRVSNISPHKLDALWNLIKYSYFSGEKFPILTHTSIERHIRNGPKTTMEMENYSVSPPSLLMWRPSSKGGDKPSSLRPLFGNGCVRLAPFPECWAHQQWSLWVYPFALSFLQKPIIARIQMPLDI